MIVNDNIMRALSLEEMREIHRNHMHRDFPRNELRPFRSIEELYARGRYLGLGLFSAEQLLGYAYFAALHQDGGTAYLFDYLAIVPDRRDSGLGSELLRRIPSALPEARYIIGEVENPDLEQDPRKKEVRQRRMQFYLQAGILDTGVLAQLFGVDYRVMEMPVDRIHTPSEIAALYERFYRSFLPERVFRSRVSVLIPEKTAPRSGL